MKWCAHWLLFLPFAAVGIGFGASADGKIDFDRAIRPILSDNCFACHGPDAKKRMADLRLDTKEGAFAKAGRIVPGDAAGSRLYQRVSSEKASVRMPPPYSGHTLTPQQIASIKSWIDEGAHWETHWAYVPPKRPEPPKLKTNLAKLKTNWTRNLIDAFILDRLEREGLKPSTEADRATLLRRVSFDLTGLPPTPAEIDSFLADKSRDAYEKRVDALLASPHYGERMTMQWLDLARYADTHGYHIDSHRDMSHWRDWVIGAFNRNMPFDKFTIEQLAGDLLPNATVEQKIATGFNRNHMINFEGGAIPEEYQTEYVVDRVETTANVWMGTTMGCARCHDHKYDPIPQRDFYRFFAFFNTIPEKGLDGRSGNADPVLQLSTPAQQKRLVELKEAITQKEDALKAANVDALVAEWEKSAAIHTGPKDGLIAHYELDGNLSDSSGNYRHGRTLDGEVRYTNGSVGRAADFNGEVRVSFGNVGDFEQAFTIAVWLKTGIQSPMTVLQKLSDAKTRRGFEMSFDQSEPLPGLKRGCHLTVRLTNQWPDNVVEMRTKERVDENEQHHLVVAYDGSGKAAGLRVFVDAKAVDLETVKDNLSGSIRTASQLEIGNREWGNPYKGQMDDLRLYARQLTPTEIEDLAIHVPSSSILFTASDKRTRGQKRRLSDYYLTFGASDTLREINRQLKSLRTEQDELDASIPTTMVMREMTLPRQTYVLGRGDYRNHGEKVTPGTPSTLPPLPQDAPHNRLGLARWLVSPEHPLTARVAVNRYWQMYFGTGLVKTVEDFGSQGDPPSHPELLDWLATEFIRMGWDIKAMQRLIVTSATYRQASKVSPELLAKDPENRLLARGPRFRLPAETVRDNALAVSGLLNDAIGGESVFPYQPKGIWEELAFGDVYSAQVYKQSHGKDLYRRSMYTFRKRTAPAPSLSTFDAPDREKCAARRLLTNSPLQALVLLNDPTYVEAARVLAQRMLKEGGRQSGQRISYGFRLATGRNPAPAELKILQNAVAQHMAHYQDEKAASELLHVGESSYDTNLDARELAAWTAVASTILNLDETITKE
jgi:hypothetical protein